MPDLPLRLRFFLTWSRVHEAWQCLECSGLARGERLSYVNEKGKRVYYFEACYDTLVHSDVETAGNVLLHRKGCKWLKEWRENV